MRRLHCGISHSTIYHLLTGINSAKYGYYTFWSCCLHFLSCAAFSLSVRYWNVTFRDRAGSYNSVESSASEKKKS